MFAQFRSRYPAGSLVSELLQIHDGQYVVRALVQLGGTTLATGLAAATRIEQAEDQARLRALTVLGIETVYESQAHLQTAQLPAPGLPHQLEPSALQPQEQHGAARLNPARMAPAPAKLDPQLNPLASNWELQEATPPDAEFDLYAQNYNLSGYDPDPEEEPEPPPPVSNGATRKKADAPRSRAVNSRSLSTPEPVDLSDIIAQTSVELKRLSWSEVQGRTYLQRTYGKRSRQQLTDEELLDFLHYLQSEPSPGEPSF